MKKNKEVSKCCRAPIEFWGTSGDTNYYICSKCLRNCEIYEKPMNQNKLSDKGEKIKEIKYDKNGYMTINKYKDAFGQEMTTNLAGSILYDKINEIINWINKYEKK